jgi:hypothetical protein
LALRRMSLEPRCPGRGSFFCALGNEAVAVALLVDGQYLLCTGALTKSRAGTTLALRICWGVRSSPRV